MLSNTLSVSISCVCLCLFNLFINFIYLVFFLDRYRCDSCKSGLVDYESLMSKSAKRIVTPVLRVLQREFAIRGDVGGGGLAGGGTGARDSSRLSLVCSPYIGRENSLRNSVYFRWWWLFSKR